jgi:predicted metalloprotease with PDZ domain
MINFDMIGRIVEKRLLVAGTKTGKGLDRLLYPIYDESGLEIVRDGNVPGGSDHMAFWGKKVPALFAIIAELHDDYHTPRDTSALINRVDAVRTVNLFHDVALAAASSPERWEFEQQERRQNNPRLGVRLGSYDRELAGIKVGSVTEGGSAAEAGFREGDVMTKWNGAPIEGLIEWRRAFREHEIGDVVPVTLVREGEAIEVQVTLKAQ